MRQLTELQERLEHLVNYSSQLIFVSGDTIAQQQRSLEDFLSLQKENTEISYFNTEADWQASDYRRTICRQLLDQTVGSYVRPLKELLKDLNNQVGPFLVCIKQAEQLPKEFLQELWEWVLHSRKQTNKQHLNIILFGETQWAENAKKWLPNKNSDKPVLLSNHSVPSSAIDQQALASLMSEQSSLFSSGLFTDTGARRNLLTNRWFILSVLSLFLVCFIGLISWQYPQYVNSLITTGSLPEPPFATTKDLELEPSKTESLPPVSETLTNSSTTLEIVENDTFSANEILVSEWQQSNDVGSDTNASQVQASTIQEVNSQTQGDFAVPDIINVEQLDAALGNQLDPEIEVIAPQDTINISPEPQRSSLAQTDVGALEQQSSSDIDNTSYKFDERVIMQLPDDSILLQLSGIQSPSVLRTYIESNGLSQSTWIYETTRYGGPWFVVLVNQSFDSLAQARSAVNELPDSVKSSAPFAKVASQVKQEIQNP